MKYKNFNNNKGMALLLAISFLMVMSFLVIEVSYETLVEYSISSKRLHKIQSHYAARGGIDIALLRLNAYQQALSIVDRLPNPSGSNQSGSKLNSEMIEKINMIWNMPFDWPISSSIPIKISTSLKNAILDIEKKSFMKVPFSIRIEPQSTKIDINNLGSISTIIRNGTRRLILAIFNKEKRNNEAFNEKYEDFDFKKVVNNISDWVDANRQSGNGGSESSSSYYDFGREHNKSFTPPNQSFKTLSELHMISGMTDELFEFLYPHITLYGPTGFNINMRENLTKLSQLKIFPSEMTEAISEKIAPEEDDSTSKYFNNRNELMKFLIEERNIDITNNENKFPVQDFPFIFDFEGYFQIMSIGTHRDISSTITTFTYDINLSKKNLKAYLNLEEEIRLREEMKLSPPSPTLSPYFNHNEKSRLPTKPKTPTIVYWREI